MKISKFIASLLISISLLAFSANKASAFYNERESEHRGDDNKGKGGNDDRDGGSGTCLPINGQAWFLLVAGLGIGSYVILNKSKEAKLESSPVKR